MEERKNDQKIKKFSMQRTKKSIKEIPDANIINIYSTPSISI